MRKVLYILSRLNDEDVDWFAATGRRANYGAGDVLIKQGAPINSLMFVLDGKVSVEVEGVGQIANLGSGEVLGEMSLVDESPPSAGGILVEPTRVLHIDRTVLNTML